MSSPVLMPPDSLKPGLRPLTIYQVTQAVCTERNGEWKLGAEYLPLVSILVLICRTSLIATQITVVATVVAVSSNSTQHVYTLEDGLIINTEYASWIFGESTITDHAQHEAHRWVIDSEPFEEYE